MQNTQSIRIGFIPSTAPVSLCLCGCLLLLLLGGCEAVSHIATSLGPDQPAERVEPVLYPEDAPVGEPLEVEVIRVSRRHVNLVNRTAHSYQDLEVYLNHQFGGTIESLPVGQSIEVSLSQFVNHHGERYPVGSLLEPDKSQKLILAEAMVDGQIHRMTVRLSEDWQRP